MADVFEPVSQHDTTAVIEEKVRRYARKEYNWVYKAQHQKKLDYYQLGDLWEFPDTLTSLKARGQYIARKEQHKYAGQLAGGEDEVVAEPERYDEFNGEKIPAVMKGIQGGMCMLRKLNEMKHNTDLNLANQAVLRFTEAMDYYPEWEALHLMRAEALRTRALMYHIPKKLQGHWTADPEAAANGGFTNGFI